MEADSGGEDGQDLPGPAHLEEDYESDTESVSSDISTVSSTGGEMTSTLYVGNFPPHIKKQQISKHFSEHGFGDNVIRVTIFFDKNTRKSKGCGIVTVTPAAIAESVIQTVHGTSLCGKPLHVAVRVHRQNRKRNAKKQAGTESKQPITPEKTYSAGRLVGMGTSPQSNPLIPSDAVESFTLDDSDSESVSSTSEEFCKVFVNSTPPFSNDINSGHLRKHFKQFKGEILNARIIRDKETKQTKGYGIITFSSLSTAENAIRNMNGSRLHGKFCIKLHSDRQSGGRQSGGRQKAPPVPLLPSPFQGSQASSSQEQLSSCLLEDSLGFGDSDNESVSSASGEAKVFVASNPPLPNFVNNQHLQDHFREFSQDGMSVRVIRDKETKKAKGYAFITFSSLAAATSAIEAKNGSLLLGKYKLKVEFERGSERRKSRPSANLYPQAQGMGQASDVFQPTGTSITDAGHFLHQSSIPPTPQLHSPPAAVSSVLVVENLNPIISEDELKAVIGLPISSCIFEVTGPDRKRAKIQCQVPSDASEAVRRLEGKQLLGHIAHAYLAPATLPSTSAPSMQAQPQPQPLSYAVKVTHLAPTVTRENLLCHFSVAGEVLNCTIHSSKNAYAHVNFKDEQTARHAVAVLNGSILNGWKINVSPKFGKVPLLSPPHLQPVTGAVSQHSPPPGMSETVPVKVTNLPPGIQEKDVFETFKCCGRIESIRVIPSNPPYAYVNYFSVADAKTASANLHETCLGGNKIRVQLSIPASSTNVSSPVNQQPPHDQPMGDLQTGRPGQEEKAMKLNPDQWNKLMNVGPHGASLFQELIGPFKSNPNVGIEPIIDQLTIRFVGVHDAVWSAYSHIANQLNKELHISDRVKMAALLEIYPNLASSITQKHHISVSGYQEGSSVIKFEGPSTGIEAARAEIDMLVCRSLSTELDIAFPSVLLASAKKRFQADKIQAHISILPHSEVSKVTVCSFSKNDHDLAVKVLRDGPCEKLVRVSTQDVIEQIKIHPCQSFTKLSSDFSVAIHTTPNMVTIQGFLLHDVQSVQKLLNKLVKDLSVKTVPLSCTPEQTAYLKHVLIDNPSEEAKSLVATLCVQVSYTKGKIILSGTPETVEAAKTQLISGPLLDGLQMHLFHFNCHFKFLSQIELYVLRPFQDRNLDFIYTTESEKTTKGFGKQDRNAPKADEQVFKIFIFSRDPVVFEEVCLALEPLAPKSRYFPIQQRALEYVRNEASNYEQRHRVRLISQLKGGSAFVIIHGLTTEGIDQCWEEINQFISSTLVVVKHIPVDIYQAKYLRQKYASELEQLKTECMELYLPLTKDPRRDDSLSIGIKGTKNQVETVQERMMELIGADFTNVTFEVTCEPKYYRVWEKRWKDVKKEQEERNDVIIEFSQSRGKDRRSSNTSDESEPDTTVSFTVFGSDPDGVKEVEDVIRTQENGRLMDHKQILLTQESTIALLKGMKSKELILGYQVNIDIDRKANQVTLSSPRSVSDDLDATEEAIQRFIGNRAATSREIVCEDPVVGLVLNSRSMSVRYLSIANTVAKPHSVSVRPLRKPCVGLVLRGSQAAVQTVEPIIRAGVIKPIEENIGQLQITVERIYAPVFTSREFKALDEKLQEDLCVVSSYPRVGKQSRVLRSILIQSSPSSHCLKLEVCRGNLVFEKVDAIVNAANEDLKHIGGLAKAILNAGGATIQTDCENYIGLHGKLKVEDAICLGAGKLPCKKVIHAVGPRWKGGKQNEEHSLYFTIYNVLSAAERENIGSVALPAISTGVFDVPEDVCARASIKAVRDYCQANPTSIIHSVRFVLFAQSVAEKFLTFLDSGIFDGCIMQQASSTSSTIPAAIPASPYSWLWENDRGSFTHFPGDVSSRLTREYLQNPGGASYCALNGIMYKIDFPTMTQTNLGTGYQRRVQRTNATSTAPEAKKSIQWYFTDDKGQLSAYSPTDSRAIETMYQTNTPRYLAINNNSYTFDFNRMCQINVSSQYRRAIQRKEVQPTPEATSAETETEETEPQGAPLKDLVVLLRGPKENLTKAKTKLEEKLKSIFKTSTISLPPVLTTALEKKLRQIAKRNEVSFALEEQAGKDGKSSKVLKLKGLTFSVQHATSAIQEEIINHQLSSSQESETQHPPEWQPQSHTTQLFPLTQGSPEWNRVEQKFKQTMQNRIVQINRIQNTWLWENYVMHKKRLGLKNDGTINEKELFHGTRGNDPKLIYEGENGFDMRFSASGRWGQANYFAVNASYSHSYAHPTSDGYREMFLVKVLTGDSYNCSSNSALRMPPVKQTIASGTSKVQLAQMRYDTVTGTTGGSQVFMTYDNDKAYPAYLIKYS